MSPRDYFTNEANGWCHMIFSTPDVQYQNLEKLTSELKNNHCASWFIQYWFINNHRLCSGIIYIVVIHDVVVVAVVVVFYNLLLRTIVTMTSKWVYILPAIANDILLATYPTLTHLVRRESDLYLSKIMNLI